MNKKKTKRMEESKKEEKEMSMGRDSKICMNILSCRCNCYTGLIQCFGVTSGIHSVSDGMVKMP